MASVQAAIAGVVAVTMPPLAKFITVVIIAKLELAAEL